MDRLYDYNDMVKVGCHDCKGCSICCQGMGTSILIDPHDAWELTRQLGVSFSELLNGPLELHVEQGLILPNIRMAGEKEQCSFLSEEGRCTIHSFRPGICRLFPLGRNYDGDTMQYFLLDSECPVKSKTKMKVTKWIEPDNEKDYHRFLIDWHNLTKAFRAELAQMEDDEQIKKLSMIFLNLFYINEYTSDDFYSEFYERVEKLHM